MPTSWRYDDPCGPYRCMPYQPCDRHAVEVEDPWDPPPSRPWYWSVTTPQLIAAVLAVIWLLALMFLVPGEPHLPNEG